MRIISNILCGYVEHGVKVKYSNPSLASGQQCANHLRDGVAEPWNILGTHQPLYLRQVASCHDENEDFKQFEFGEKGKIFIRQQK